MKNSNKNDVKSEIRNATLAYKVDSKHEILSGIENKSNDIFVKEIKEVINHQRINQPNKNMVSGMRMVVPGRTVKWNRTGGWLKKKATRWRKINMIEISRWSGVKFRKSPRRKFR